MSCLVVTAAAQAETGAAPTVTVGADQVVTLSDTAFLPGTVSDDGLPAPSQLTFAWSVASGPGEVTFDGRDRAHASARFSVTGVYVLRLTVSDGGASVADDLTVTVRERAGTTLRVPADHPTIQAALDAAPVNGLVLVSPGTYKENLHVPRTLTLASTYYTTGDRSMVDKTIISAASPDIETVLVPSGARADTRVVGFTIRDGKDGIKVRGAAVVEDNVLTALGTDAVDFPHDAAGLVRNNVMRQNGDDGVDVNSASVVIADNLMRENAGDGVETRVTNAVAPVKEVIVRRNRILSNVQDGLQIIDDDDIASSPAQSATLFTVDRNLIIGNGQAGLGLMDLATTTEDYRGADLVERILVTHNVFDANNHGIAGGDNLVAVNNVLARHQGPALKNVDGGSWAAYNHFFANDSANSSSNVDTATAFTGDPMLDDAYAPLPGSPVIDAGTAMYSLLSGEQAFTVDTYNGTAPDIGAVESLVAGTPDHEGPVVTMSGASWRTVLTGRSTVGWTGTDSSGIAVYQVERRAAAAGKTFGAWSRTTQSGTSTPLSVAVGSTVCLRVRGVDTLGQVGAYATPVCRTAPVDDAALTGRGSVRRLTGTPYYRSTVTRVAGTDSRLRLGNVRAGAAQLVATTCSTCGSVRVFYGSTLVRTLSLTSSTRRDKRRFTLPNPSGTSTITLRPGSARKILIDGLSVRAR